MSVENQPVPEIEISRISKWFGKHKVLDDVSLSVAQGEAVAVIGPSGSGKTTLLRCINFLEDYQQGTIKVAGEYIGYQHKAGSDSDRQRQAERDIALMRTKVGMVFQSFNLFPHMTVLRNITLAPTKILKQSTQQANETAMQLLERVGLKDKADALPASLSGGQQQRVAVARALAMKPKAMLFDEVTSALDPELVAEVLDVIRELIADGMTMMIVTHEMSFARAFSDRVVFMADGKMLEVNSPENIFENPQNPRLISFLERFRKGYQI
jgi:ABC-type polar amino acid transport system ATPase subunit